MSALRLLVALHHPAPLELLHHLQLQLVAMEQQGFQWPLMSCLVCRLLWELSWLSWPRKEAVQIIHQVKTGYFKDCVNYSICSNSCFQLTFKDIVVDSKRCRLYLSSDWISCLGLQFFRFYRIISHGFGVLPKKIKMNN